MNDHGNLTTLMKRADILLVVVLLAGCSENSGGGATAQNSVASIGISLGKISRSSGASPPSASPSTVPSSLPAPVETLHLQGSPPTTVSAGTQYYFRPTLSKSAMAVTFTIADLPTWAHFDSTTGALAGTPATKDEGTTGQIIISANTPDSSASLTPFTIKVGSAGVDSTASTSLSWIAPTENTDGSPATQLAGYHIYYGPAANEMTTKVSVNGAASTSYMVDGLSSGTYYFTVAAYTNDGAESSHSAVVKITI